MADRSVEVSLRANVAAYRSMLGHARHRLAAMGRAIRWTKRRTQLMGMHGAYHRKTRNRHPRKRARNA